MSLIDDIVAASRARLDERKRGRPLDEFRARALDAPRSRITFREALEAKPFSLIAEIKSKSPSAGEMDKANVAAALRVYDETPSVSAVSILTDEVYFGNSLEDLRRARAKTSKPLLRKDFIVEEYQVWEAREAGADAILLMAGLQLRMDVLFELGMSNVEPQKLAAIVPPEAPIWGINSRRFQTSRFQIQSRLGRFIGKEMSVRPHLHDSLRSLIPSGKLAVAESGVHDPATIHELHALEYRAALIGTAFLKSGVSVAGVVRSFDEEIARLAAPAEARAASFSGVPHVPTA
jgi:indole-3-glycerol phosphate synthase